MVELALPADIDVFELAAIGLVLTDRAGRLRRVNPAFCELLGRSSDELVGTSFLSLTTPDDLAVSQEAMDDLLTKAVESTHFEKRYLRSDGSPVWVELNVRSLTDADGEVVGFLSQAVDITVRKRAERNVLRHSHQLEEAQRIAGLGSFEQDPVTGLFAVSDELRRIAGLDAVIDVDTMMKAIHPDDRALMGAAVGACMIDRTPSDVVHRMVRPDGTVVWMHSRAAWAVDDDGRSRIIGTGLDISDRKTAEIALDHQAFHDTLTGLANKSLFVDRMIHALHRAEREATPVAVLFIDLDDFQTVNDALGHAAGDQLIAAVGQRFAATAKAGDTVARFGGDDFAILLESGDMPQAVLDIAERLADTLKAPFTVGDSEVSVRASIGAAIGYPGDETSDDLLRDADLAMYLAKHNGKDRLEIFRPGMQDEAHRRLALITELRNALEHHELEVFYQPIVRVLDSAAAGAEALVRWHHPRRGLIRPTEFVSVAESTGLIVPMGHWVLNEACRQAQAWLQAGVVDDDFYISVNLSARQLAEPTLVNDVSRALLDSGLPPHALVLEITESTLMIDVDAGLARLHSLKDLGLRLAIDDYGTGYSSLNRLSKLPVDMVKIDKTFIDRLTLNAEGAALVRSVIDVTSALGLTSIAEGVELPGQRAALDALGCDCIQGYLFAKPTPASETTRTLRSFQVNRHGLDGLSTPVSKRTRTRWPRGTVKRADAGRAASDMTVVSGDTYYMGMLDALPERVVRYRLPDLTIVYCNEAWAAGHQVAPAEVVGHTLNDFLSPSEWSGLGSQLARLGADTPFLADDRPRAAPNAIGQWVEWVDKYLPGADGNAEVLAVGRDVTGRHIAELNLAASEARFRDLADRSTDVVWRFVLEPLPHFDYVSPSVEKILGYPPSFFVEDFSQLLSILDDEGKAAIDRGLLGEPLPERSDFRYRHANGSIVIGEMQITPIRGGLQGVGRDVTELRQLQADLAALALHDPLTGLANRRLLDELLEADLARTQRGGQPLAVAFVDLDGLKDVNDNYGHDAGDTVLCETARRLLSTVRGADVVARLGGDEFVIVYEPNDASSKNLMQRIDRALAPPIEITAAASVCCSASIGIATTDAVGYDRAALVAAADDAMYIVKRAHRRRV